MRRSDFDHVYCTNCVHFEVVHTNWGYESECVYSKECNLNDEVDSKPFHERPFYLGKDEVRTTSKIEQKKDISLGRYSPLKRGAISGLI